jgi:hypothetical protein
MQSGPPMPALDVVAALALLTSTFVVVVLLVGLVEERIRATVRERIASAGPPRTRATSGAPPAVESTPAARVA